MKLEMLSILSLLTCTNALAQAQQAPALIGNMTGTWSVTERMWPGADAAPMVLPAATAHRRLVGDGLLQETMEALSGTKPQFTRVSSLNYNTVSKQYEYVSWDTRAPQMMVEKGNAVIDSSAGGERTALMLYGGRFVAPQWGKVKNVAFRYRLEVGQVQNGRQIVRLYLRPLSGDTREFRAFEYVYTNVA